MSLPRWSMRSKKTNLSINQDPSLNWTSAVENKSTALRKFPMLWRRSPVWKKAATLLLPEGANTKSRTPRTLKEITKVGTIQKARTRRQSGLRKKHLHSSSSSRLSSSWARIWTANHPPPWSIPTLKTLPAEESRTLLKEWDSRRI